MYKTTDENIEIVTELMHIITFDKSHWFWWKVEQSYWTVIDWVFSKWLYFLEPCYNDVLQVSLLSIPKKEKDESDDELSLESFLLLQILTLPCS